MNSIYETYKGMPCIRREINPKNWTWTYLYENKLAKKNKAKYDILIKNLSTIKDKKVKNENIINEIKDKFFSYVKNENIDINDINKKEYDDIKGIITLRNKFNKSIENLKDVKEKISLIEKEIKDILDIGIEDIIKVPSKDIVYAYDMEIYVKFHPEEFKNKN